jgi:hypothetical protein
MRKCTKITSEQTQCKTPSLQDASCSHDQQAAGEY